MQFSFNFYGNQVSGHVPDTYDWCLPLLEASLELKNGVPICPRFHCAGLRDLDYSCVVESVKGKYKMLVDEFTTFVHEH